MFLRRNLSWFFFSTQRSWSPWSIPPYIMLLDKHVIFHCSPFEMNPFCWWIQRINHTPSQKSWMWQSKGTNHPKFLKCQAILESPISLARICLISVPFGGRHLNHARNIQPPYIPLNPGCLIGILIVVNYTPHITGVGTFIPHIYTTSFFFHIVHVPLVDIATGLNRSTSGMGIFISTRGAGASGCAKVDGWIRDVVGLHRHPLRLDSYKDLESH